VWEGVRARAREWRMRHRTSEWRVRRAVLAREV
jgi:hypothetical protein